MCVIIINENRGFKKSKMNCKEQVGGNKMM